MSMIVHKNSPKADKSPLWNPSPLPSIDLFCQHLMSETTFLGFVGYKTDHSFYLAANMATH